MERSLDLALLSAALGDRTGLPTAEELQQLMADVEVQLLLRRPDIGQDLLAAAWYLHGVASVSQARQRYTVARQRQAFLVSAHIFDLALNQDGWTPVERLSFGFAAAIAHRGIRLVRLPTTTLAQADSGVGVKNAVNMFAKKNWCGSFAVPWAVVNDESLLETLPDRDFTCGFSEAVKVSLLKDAAFFDRLPDAPANFVAWPLSTLPAAEGLAMPAQVNFVAKGTNIIELGYKPSGATAVAMTYLNTGYLWDKVRVQGGAYGASSGFQEVTGSFVFTSYRDPNLLKTLDAYDAAGKFLTRDIGEAELTRSIIGVIGRMDAYQLPDAKGYTALVRELVGETEAHRQLRRDEVLGAGVADFRKLAEVLGAAARIGRIAVLGPDTALKAANEERGDFLKITRVL